MIDLFLLATLSRDRIDVRPDFKLINPLRNYTPIMRHFETNFPFPRLYPRREKKEKWRKNKIYIVKNIMASSSKESTNKRYSAFAFTQFSLYTVLLRVHVEETELGMGNTATDSDAIKGDVLREALFKTWKFCWKLSKIDKTIEIYDEIVDISPQTRQPHEVELEKLRGRVSWMCCKGGRMFVLPAYVCEQKVSMNPNRA